MTTIFTLGELSVDLDNDKIGEMTGNIKLTLNSDPNSANTYQLGENIEGVISILDDDAPELTISGASEQVDEAVATANFVISAVVSPNKNVTIYYNLAESGNLIDTEENSAGIGKTAMLDFTDGKTEATLAIKIATDTLDEENGTIKVTLVEDGADQITYTVAPSPDDSAEVEVIDDDGLPQIIISTSTPTIEEGASAIFELTATPEGSITAQQTKTVEFDIVQEGDFLMWRVPRILYYGFNICNHKTDDSTMIILRKQTGQ